MLQSLVKKQVTTDSYTVPQLLVMTQDTLVVTALYKSLRDKFKDSNVRVHKLFARHIPLKEHQDSLTADCQGQVINVYIGTPGRIRALAQAGTIKLSSKKFKATVFDCRLNPKQFTMLETHETRDDCFGVLPYMVRQVQRRKHKVYLIK